MQETQLVGKLPVSQLLTEHQKFNKNTFGYNKLRQLITSERFTCWLSTEKLNKSTFDYTKLSYSVNYKSFQVFYLLAEYPKKTNNSLLDYSKLSYLVIFESFNWRPNIINNKEKHFCIQQTQLVDKFRVSLLLTKNQKFNKIACDCNKLRQLINSQCFTTWLKTKKSIRALLTAKTQPLVIF